MGGEALNTLVDISGHGYIDIAFGIIPGYGQAAIELARAVYCGRVLFLYRRDEVVEVGTGRVLHTEVVDDEGEGDVPCSVGEEAGCERDLVVSLCG